METVTALKEAIIHYLSGYAFVGELAGVRLVKEFPGDPSSFPLRAPVVAVGIEGVELVDSGFGGYLGEDSATAAALYGKAAAVTVCFDIHCPPASGGDRCHQVYEALCDALLLGAAPLGFHRVWCGKIAFAKETGSNRLEAHGALRAAVTRQDRSLMIQEFDVRSGYIDGGQ